MVVEDFRTGATGAGVGHLPEIVGRERAALVVADANDPLRRHADLVVPDRIGLVVGVVDGDGKLFRRKLEHVGQQLPRPDDGLALEIVAERPVAEHFEKGVMACRVANRVEIVVLAAGTQAALHVGRPHEAELLAAEEHVLELHHARIGEHQRRVVGRHQRTRWHDGVPLGTEEVEEGGSDFRSFHANHGG